MIEYKEELAEGRGLKLLAPTHNPPRIM